MVEMTFFHFYTRWK